jgi:hypothetical protein
MSVAPEDLIRRAEQALAQLTDQAPNTSDAVEDLATELRLCITLMPHTRAQLGPLLGRLVAAARTPRPEPLDWVDVVGGRIAVGHRPRLAGISSLRAMGATHVWTLLGEREGALDIGAAVRAAGLHWIWLPLANGEPPGPELLPQVGNVFREFRVVLQGGGAVFVHCSAGIHRTGMMVHALLRSCGHSRVDALECLRRLRKITSDGVGEHRLAWGDQFAT